MLDEAEIRGMAREAGFEGEITAQVVVQSKEGELFTRVVLPLDHGCDDQLLRQRLKFELSRAMKSLRQRQAHDRGEKPMPGLGQHLVLGGAVYTLIKRDHQAQEATLVLAADSEPIEDRPRTKVTFEMLRELPWA